MNRSLTLVPLVAAVLAAPSLAQETKVTPPAAAPPAGGVAGLSPEAKKLLEQSAAAYKKLNSYQSEVIVHFVSPQKTTDLIAKFLVQRPLRARFVVTKGTPVRVGVSNGVSIFRFVEGAPTYEKIPLLPGTNLSTVLEQVGGLSFPIVPWLLTQSDPISRIAAPGFTSGVIGKPVSLDGSVSDEVEFTIGSAERRQGTARIAIDRADHLVRRISIEQLGPDGNPMATQVEEYRRIAINPELPKTAFGFAPPAGVSLAGSAPVTPEAATPATPKGAIPELPQNAKSQTLAGGLKLTEIKLGAGKTCPEGATVTVHYTGWLPDGTKFESSVGGEPATFPLSRVVKGWGLGIPGMKIGGTRRLVIPPALGYGERGTPGGPIPPNATLIFDIELIAIQ